ncbi:MAG TPA: DinB family protein [Chloroflexia bacterium]|jgi:uncharacterized damage-inducible protein DinB
MAIDADTISDPQVRQFFQAYLPQRQIVRDFYELLPDDKLDYRIVETGNRRADSPRESLVHILETQLAYFNGITSGSLDFESMGAERYQAMSKQQLLDELAALDEKMYRHSTSPDFDPAATISTSWGDETTLGVLYLVRDHDILHIGWNLALMDHLDVERYQSLVDIWG